MPAYHLIIKGKVQGVFFRASAKETAELLGVTGWVKNTREGNVEAFINGDENKLQEFIAWCKRGPSKAIVTEVVIDEALEESFKDFSIRRG